MDYIQLIGIMEQLKDIDSRKALKLAKLMQKHDDEKNTDKKKDYERKIKNFICNLFFNCLNRDLRNELSNLCACINADRYELEHREKSWYVGSEGAKQFRYTDGEFEEISYVPRYYGEGFVLDDNASDEEKRFFMENHAILSSIARDMDRKEEIVTYYQPKDNRIPRDFTEVLVDYIGFRRIETKEIKKGMK
jgi:hypothetical protein